MIAETCFDFVFPCHLHFILNYNTYSNTCLRIYMFLLIIALLSTLKDNFIQVHFFMRICLLIFDLKAPFLC